MVKKPTTCTDNRRFNNPHKTVYAAGHRAALDGLPVHSCPHRHPAMRNSWLKGFTAAQQIELPFE
ncbi:CrpP family ICE-associated protein [Pseudomonas lopnurensis]|uniref:CrpP family ICE-associated protein n=1 Tax=Pseudomonas lopnurensis TaxID=1477517 RepID=UPI0028ABBE84|nr:CrpP family ICE-associated protein [Pseudomonas lopnurensis]